jgi:hypothetical protein
MNFDDESKTLKLRRLNRNAVVNSLGAIVFLLASLSAAGQIPKCNVGKDAPAFGFWNWAAGTTVKVYVLEGDFDEGDLRYVLKPLQNWNAAIAATGPRVKFEYAGSTATPLYCENCLTIMRGAVFHKATRHATELNAYSARGDQVLTWAQIRVDHTLTNPGAISNAVAHELGHSLGLLDCYNCKAKSTVMNQFKRFNEPNEMESPTACDIVQVNAAYRELAVGIRPSPVKVGLADEGEEPVDDDTPIVVRRP